MATTRRPTTTLAGLVLLVAVLTGCEGAIEHNLTKRFAPSPPVVDPTLRSLARIHSAEMCAAGELLQTPDPEAAYGWLSIEIVDREPLDPFLPAPQDNHAATSAVWARLQQRAALDISGWRSMGVGEHVCGDGQLYVTVVLSATSWTAGWTPGATRITASNDTVLGGITADG